MCLIITTRKQSLEQGNIFTPFCHSFHEGGSASVHAGIPPPRPDTHPPGSRPPWNQAPPPPGPGAPLGPGTLQGPKVGTPPRTRGRHPPGAVHAGRYGQLAGGTHPTGMQSRLFCLQLVSSNYYFSQFSSPLVLSETACHLW